MSNNTPSMKISHNIIEHLGLKLYQNKPTNVIAELVSNAWDANAKNLKINLQDSQRDFRFISIEDDGCGMDLETLSNTYLVIGKAKYNDLNEQKEIIDKMQRKPMGRKGIGKLAPFGICNEIHLITVRNNLCNWLHFNYQEMIKVGKSSSVENYYPDFILNNKELSIIDSTNVLETCKIFIPQINEFLKNILESDEKSGTLIILTNLKLKKSISVDQLIQSIGQRFTVTIGRPDFRININNILITEDNALPQWELRIPESGVITDRVCVDGREKEIQYWIGFVKEATWPTEHAGIGVYAHGKIAQDRPFFFKVEGREILSRYMYGVIEADLVEELEEDLISTDRTSINWENSSFENFFTKGQEITKNALKQYLEHRQNSEKDKNHQRIKKISEMEKYKLSSQEKVYLGELLNDITPKLGKDEDKIEELTKILAKSWLNEPSRRVVKNLWIDVEKEENLIQLQSTLMKLSDELIPQSLSLTRTFAQRVFALTKLQERIADGKETPLQLLLEDFPWILSHSYEKLTKRQSLTTVIKSAEAQGKIAHRQIALQKGETKPDFVFLSSANEDEMLIIELKNNEPVEFPEFDQLRSYVEYLHLTYPATKIQGILIASDVSTQIQEMIKNHHLLEFMTWDYLLKKSRQEYITFLTALLLGTDESPQEAIEWGGKEVEEFLHDIAKNDLEIKKLMERYNS